MDGDRHQHSASGGSKAPTGAAGVLPPAVNPTLQRTFRGHRGPVTAAAFHPALTQVASSSLDGAVMVWNYKTTMRAFRFVGHRGPVNTVAFNNHGNLVASGSSDTTIRFWIPSVKGESTSIKAHAGAVRCVAFSADGRQLVSGSDDKSVKLWNATTQRFAQSFPGHQNWVRAVDISQDGRLVTSGGDDKVVHIWDVASRTASHSLYDHTDSVTCVAFHPDGHRIAAGSNDKTINVWDLRMNSLVQHYDAHSDAVTALSFHPSGNWLLSASNDSSVRLWDIKEGFLFCTLSAHEGPVLGAKYSPCGSQFATTGQDGLVMVWDSTPAIAAPHSGRGPMPSRAPYVDPTNTVLSPLPTDRHVGAAARQPLAGVAQQGVVRVAAKAEPALDASRRPQTAQQAQSARLSRPPNMAPPPVTLAPSAAAATLPPSSAHGRDGPHAGTNMTAVTTELPIEQMIRQVDLATQTQKILESRLTNVELAQRTMMDTLRDRDTRVSQQIEVLRQQGDGAKEEALEQRREMARLRESIAAQAEMLKQVLEHQRELFAQLTLSSQGSTNSA